MAYSAQVFRILIASPSDVDEERDIIVKVIQEWNDLNSAERQLVLLPLKWETHSAPEYNVRPQEIINYQVVDQCDLLVGVFWTRIGSPTGLAESGTLEEIERVAEKGKPVMLYFSKANKNPDDINLEQLQKLRDFKSKTLPNALIENYGNHVEFRDKLARQLEIQLRTLLANSMDDNIIDEAPPSTNIILSFAEPLTGEKIGCEQNIESTIIKISDYDAIPKYIPKTKYGSVTGGLEFDLKDENYYKNLIDGFVRANINKPVRFWLTNIGSIGARDVFIDINIKSSCTVMYLLTRQDLHKTPGIIHLNSSNIFRMKKISENHWNVNFEVRALQPKREFVPNDMLYIGAGEEGIISLDAKIYADTLSEPITQSLEINFKLQNAETDFMSVLQELNVDK